MKSYLLRHIVVTTVLGMAAAGAAQAVDDGKGRDWRQVTDTRGLTRAQVAAACPADGATACRGTVAGVDLSEWTWASEPQVLALFSDYAPEIVAAPGTTLSGFQYGTAAATFQSRFALTVFSSGCTTYGGCFDFRQVAGTSATIDAYGNWVAASVTLNEGTGQFTVGPVAATEPNNRGYWLWRSTGMDDGSVHAYDDYGRLTTPAGGAAISSVLANDYVGGVRATTQNVSLEQLSASAPGIALDLADGSADIAAGTAIGTYSLTYRICSLVNPALCDDASATVVVPSFAIVANADFGYAAFGAGGTPVANVLANDTVGAIRATVAMVILSQVSSTSYGITLDAGNGSVNVAPGTPSGTHSLVYQICERSNPTHCAQATVTLIPNTIDAVDDYFRWSSKSAGATPSVLSNDWFSGARATSAQVSITLLGPLPSGVAFNTGTGVFSTRGKVTSGLFYTSYRICEIASPSNCDQAAVTLDLTGKNN